MKKLSYFLPVILVLFLTCGIFPFGPSGDSVPTIFFSAVEFDNASPEIYSVKIDGSEYTLLSKGESPGGFQMSLSHDGKMIAYVEGDKGIITMNIDGTIKKQLTFGIQALYPSWSPDGNKIAFVIYARDGSVNIFTINPDGSNFVQLTDSPESKGKPHWLPDGSQIYFNSTIGLNIMNKDGSNRKQLTDFRIDGEDLLYSSENRSLNFLKIIYIPQIFYQLYKIDIDGSEPQLVRTFDEEKDALSLSPDLQKIVYRKRDDPEYRLYIMNVDGSGEQLVTRGEFFAGGFSWSPDSQYILYREFGNDPVNIKGGAIIYVIRPDGTDKVFITDRLDKFREVEFFWIF